MIRTLITVAIAVILIAAGILQIIFRGRLSDWQLAHVQQQRFSATTPTRVLGGGVITIIFGGFALFSLLPV